MLHLPRSSPFAEATAGQGHRGGFLFIGPDLAEGERVGVKSTDFEGGVGLPKKVKFPTGRQNFLIIYKNNS